MASKFALLVCSLALADLGFAADWVVFQDPIEKAFTIEVPRGWTAKGGLFRLGYSDYRMMIDLISPDGKLNVRIGDVAVPNYALPASLHPEGDTIDLGAQAQMTVSRYHVGQEYAAAYAKTRFKDVCSSLAAQPAPSPAPRLTAIPEDSTVKQSSEGEAAFRCDASRIAYAYAMTALYQGFWQVHLLASYVAPADQVATARAILEQGTRSLKLNDAWLAYQKKMDADALVYQQQRQRDRRRVISQQVAQFETSMQAMQGQVAAFERGQARQAKQVESWGNILTGITPTTDPYGNTHELWTGSKSGYWMDGRGNYVNSDLSPGPGWVKLTPKP